MQICGLIDVPFISISSRILLLPILLIVGFRIVLSLDVTLSIGEFRTISLNNLSNDHNNWVSFDVLAFDNKSVDINKAVCNRQTNNTCSNGLTIIGEHLGRSNISLRLNKNADDEDDTKQIYLLVRVVREKTHLDRIFEISLVCLVSLIYINFGCALDKDVTIEIVKKPIAPLIGILCQYLIMPMLSFIIGYVLLRNQFDLRLGLFFTGISPAGGASNVWTCLLNGNLNLSVTMTTLSIIAAFFMMPLWIFTLGRKIFTSANIVLPYSKITSYTFGLVIPLLIGVSFQKICPKLSNFLVRILKCFSSILILFIIMFAIVTNYHLFQFFTWQIVIVGLCLSWFGFLFGFIVAYLCKQPFQDVVAISIETGVQNTGISIFMLRKTLPEPESEIAIVIPCAVALMTPIPLLIIYIYQKIRSAYETKQNCNVDVNTYTPKETCLFDIKNRS